MKSTKTYFLLIALFCIALLCGAVYFQVVEEMAPCPWCVIQRYIFCAIAIISLIFAFAPHTAQRIGLWLVSLLGLAGIGAASWLIWVQAHPGLSCGIDPMETALNKYVTARWFPTLFEANGFCTTMYDDIMGLSIPQWSCISFVIITLATVIVLIKRK